MPGGEIDDQPRDEERRDAAGTALEHLRVHLLDERKASDAGADDHPDALVIAGGNVQRGVIDGHLGRGHGVVNEGVGLLDLLLLDPRLGLEAVDLAGDLAGEGGGVEFGDAADAGASFEQAAPGRLVADPQRRDHADPADDNTAFFHARR